MTYIEAHGFTKHPARDRLLFQARDENEDLGQRDAARATLIRLVTRGAWSLPARKPPEPPTPEDMALRAMVVNHGCCGGGP
jgi:hypothetical protein